MEEVRNLMVEVETLKDQEHNDTLKATLKLARTPIWYWTGLLIIGGLIMIGLIGDLTLDSTVPESKGP